MQGRRAHLDEEVKELVGERLGDVEPDDKVFKGGRRGLWVLQDCLDYEFDLFEQERVVRGGREDRHPLVVVVGERGEGSRASNLRNGRGELLSFVVHSMGAGPAPRCTAMAARE
jgi:hypothetical protein